MSSSCSIRTYIWVTIALLMIYLIMMNVPYRDVSFLPNVSLIEDKSIRSHEGIYSEFSGKLHHNAGYFNDSRNTTNNITQTSFKTTSSHRQSKNTRINKQQTGVTKKSFEKYLLSNFPGSQRCVPPTDDDDLPRHVLTRPVFTCDKQHPLPIPSSQRSTMHRSQMEITCNADVTMATAKQRQVTYDDQLQMFDTKEKKACLHQYIRQHCYDDKAVPNVIHLLWYGKAEMTFKNAIGLYSIFTIAKPCLVIFHGNVEPTGAVWDAILPVATNLVRVHIDPQTHIGRVKIKYVQTQADIGRIHILLEYGGIYLDSDMVILHKLDIFRDVQFAANKAGSNSNLANGVMLAVPGQELLKIWLDKWKTYGGSSWNSHSVLLLTSLAEQYPHLISHLGPIFIKYGYNDTPQLYKRTCSLGESFGVHLYNRNFPFDSDVNTIKKHNSTFGRLARFVLFGDPNVCP